ncbi:MAG: tetratricopeptide repeat protein [Planctomycetia bacterium]|nr:tetratricopeptide repeat protein [Planctomycetia bacterium]
MTSTYCQHFVRTAVLLLGLGTLGLVPFSASAQVTPDQMAELTLNAARKGYNEKNYPIAVAKFREFLAKFAGHKDAPVARYGLALALLEGPDRDHTGALEQLQALAGAKDFPDHPYVLYYLGVAQRGIGVKTLAQIAAKPQEAPQLKAAANQRFDEAAKQFAAAVTAFGARVKEPVDEAKLPLDLEWAARSRCDQAEMQLRLLKTKEAQEICAPFVKGSPLAKSRYRQLGLYYHGFATFLLQDYNMAGRSLSLLTPFSDPVFGTHGRYLLARVHHIAGELTEAKDHYEGVLTDFGKQKTAAVEALKQPQRFKDDPDEKARLESLVKDAPPDHIARAAFFQGVLHYEAARFADAQARFASVVQQFPGSPLLIEAQLRQGFCQVQLKDFANAIKTLQPLAEKEPRLADQALLWIGKAQAGSADPSKADQVKQALQTAINTLGQAAGKAQQLMAADPEAKLRRGEILIELADIQQAAGQHKEAAATYDAVLNEKLIPQRDEEVLQRRIAAMHLAGDFAGSDQTCVRFQQSYPKSPLLPLVLFRHAENAYFQMLAAEKIQDAGTRAKEVARLQDETAKRYQNVIEKFPEFQHVNLARYGLGMIHYKKGDFEKAQATLDTIPQPERAGSLALTPYLLADCMIRQTPLKADDALAAGRVQQQLQGAVEQLEGFIASDPKGPLTPDALIKVGHCHQRLGQLQAQPPEKVKVLQASRAAYERLLKDFPQHALAPQAVFERAKTIHQAGDRNQAMNELRKFAADPLKNAPVAPMAMLQLATLLREQNSPQALNPKIAEEAVNVLAAARQQYEGALAKDPERAGWATLLAYHHGAALREAGKLAEARAVFDQVAKNGGNRPEANDAVLRAGQCLQQEGMLKLADARKKLATPNLKPEEVTAAQKTLEDGFKAIRDVTGYYESQVDPLQKKNASSEARARIHYEAAWAYRLLAEPEVAAVRTKMQQEALKKQQDEAVKKDPKWKPPAVVVLPEVPLAQVPVQPAEQKARAHYQALLAFTDVPLAVDGRLELSELLTERDDYNGAIALINQAIDKEPSAELTEKLRLRLGVCLAGKKDYKAALAQFDTVAKNQKSPNLAQAHYRAGECLIEMGDFQQGSARLAIFRDNGQFHNVPTVSDRALLRLGYALGQMNQWDASRNAYEQLNARFGNNSPWIHEARYGIGWAFQNQKAFDQAVNAYSQVVAGTAAEIGARAQLQIGLCRLEQKRHPEATTAFLSVPFTYNYPELSAVALVEAARTFVEVKQKDQAEKLLERVIQDHPQSKWAEVAKERLEALKKS